MLEMGDKFRSIAVLLAAAMEMDCREDDEHEMAFQLVDKALKNCRILYREIEGEETRHA